MRKLLKLIEDLRLFTGLLLFALVAPAWARRIIGDSLDQQIAAESKRRRPS